MRKLIAVRFNVNETEVINKTIEFVKSKLSGESTGHDWWHIHRVLNNAKLILSNEPKANSFVVQLAAILHDVSDWKFNNGDDSVGPKISREFLTGLNVDYETINHVCSIIETMSFKGAGVKTKMATIEGQIVQDSDRLDAIGAIGIARAFAYGAFNGQEIYNPDILPKMHANYEDYKTSKTTTVNHFYEKLLLLHDRMNTESARNIAIDRQKIMIDYLDRFRLEWDGLK